jgi:hypothetical protein
MEKKWETVIVVVLIAVVICLLVPVIKVVIDNARFSGVKSGVNATAENVKDFYLNETISGTAELPFKVTFNESGYSIFSNGKLYTSNNQLEEKLIPTGGSIVVDENNQVSVNNLRYQNYICNKLPNTAVECKEIS